MKRKLFAGFLLFTAVLLTSGGDVSSTVPSGRDSEKETKHIVKKGETVWGIARKYGVNPEEVIEANKLKEPYVILPGQTLLIPSVATSPSGKSPTPSAGGGRHVVRKGETVWAIARTYGVNPEDIIKANRLENPDKISPGQELIIPGRTPASVPEQDVVSLCRLRRGVRARKWLYIVIHHSGTSLGNAAIFDRHHRRLGMKNGLAYHFVIGNGKGSKDGEIEVGGRWTKQLHGGHCSVHRMNQIAIGICLVGDFEKTYPTRKQMDSLVSLLKYLMRKYDIPKGRVIGHRDVRRGHTKCPGKNFSLTALRKKL
jgi:LysM repeat protein